MLHVVVVDGIIGAGKSTYIDVIATQLKLRGWNVFVVKEPVDKWSKCGILKLFYEDPKRWGYHFQCKAFHDRIVENIEAYKNHVNDTDIFILERSPLSDDMFMEMLHDDKVITDIEYVHYKEWWNLWHMLMPYTPTLFVYLRPDLDVCMQRVRERARNGETGVTREYQEKLLQKHDMMFHDDELFIKGAHGDRSVYVPCIRLTTNENFRDNQEIQKRCGDQFEKMLLEESHNRVNYPSKGITDTHIAVTPDKSLFY